MAEKNELLEKLLAQREEFLKKHPHLVPFQEEIDRLMDNAGSNENRMAVIGILVEGKLNELKDELNKLQTVISRKE